MLPGSKVLSTATATGRILSMRALDLHPRARGRNVAGLVVGHVSHPAPPRAWTELFAVLHMQNADTCDSWRNLSELHPLEEGKHAAESGMDLKAYAEASGKAHSTLFKKVAAWRVLGSCDFHVEIGTVAESWRNLAEIHAAPEWLCPISGTDGACVGARR